MIRAATPADRAAIRALVSAAFGQPAEAGLVDRLRADGDVAIELVAADGIDLAGHVLFSRLRAPADALALAPVSVAPARQRGGIGAALVRAGLAQARADGWRAVFVLGDPAYYGRFGFDAALAAGYASPYAGTCLMALALDPAWRPAAGPLVHAPAFAAP